MAHGRIKLLDGSKVMFDVTYRMGKPQDLTKIKDEKGFKNITNQVKLHSFSFLNSEP